MAKKQSQNKNTNKTEIKNKKHEISKKKDTKEVKIKKEKTVKVPLTLDEMPHMHPLGNATYSFASIVEQLFTQYANLLFPHVDDDKKFWHINLKNKKIKVYPP